MKPRSFTYLPYFAVISFSNYTLQTLQNIDITSLLRVKRRSALIDRALATMFIHTYQL